MKSTRTLAATVDARGPRRRHRGRRPRVPAPRAATQSVRAVAAPPGATWKMKAKPDDGRIEVELRGRQQPGRPGLVGHDQGQRRPGVLRHAGHPGAERLVLGRTSASPTAPGPTRFVGVANNAQSGETCTARVSLVAAAVRPGVGGRRAAATRGETGDVAGARGEEPLAASSPRCRRAGCGWRRRPGPWPGSAREAHHDPRRIVGRFVVANTVAVVLLLGVGLVVSRAVARDEALLDARRTTDLLATAVVEPLVDPRVLAGEPGALAELDDVIRTRVLDETTVRVKIWTADGTIVYSDEPELIGTTFPLGEEQLAAMADGVSTGGAEQRLAAGEPVRAGWRLPAGGLPPDPRRGRDAAALRDLRPVRLGGVQGDATSGWPSPPSPSSSCSCSRWSRSPSPVACSDSSSMPRTSASSC